MADDAHRYPAADGALKRPLTRSTVLLLDHGWLLAFAVGSLMIASAIALSVEGRDTSLMAVSGTVLVFLGVTAGRLIQFEVGREGLKMRYDLDNRASELLFEGARKFKESDDDEDAAEQLFEKAQAVSEAATDDEKQRRVAELERVVHSPLDRIREAVEWVASHEKAAGRHPVAVKRSSVGNLESPPRLIQVRLISAVSPGHPSITVPGQLVQEARTNSNVYLYVVEGSSDEGSERRLRVFDAAKLVSLVDESRAMYRVSTRSDEFQSAPGVEALVDDRRSPDHGTDTMSERSP